MQAWEAMLDPAIPDPGYETADDVPTDRARRVTIGFYLESIDGISLHDSQWKGVLDIWCRWKDDPDAPGGADFDPFEHLIAVNGSIGGCSMRFTAAANTTSSSAARLNARRLSRS
jgi:hypothetical protein